MIYVDKPVIFLMKKIELLFFFFIFYEKLKNIIFEKLKNIILLEKLKILFLKKILIIFLLTRHG